MSVVMRSAALSGIRSSSSAKVVATRGGAGRVSRVVPRATEETPAETETAAPAASKSMSAPSWLPAPLTPAFTLIAGEMSLEEAMPAKVKEVLDMPMVAESRGFTPMAETLNGRAAMLGFFACMHAEFFSEDSFLAQLGSAPLAIALTVAAITAATFIPGSKGVSVEDAKKDLPAEIAGFFTESTEKINGRAAMVGLAALLPLEVLKNGALF